MICERCGSMRVAYSLCSDDDDWFYQYDCHDCGWTAMEPSGGRE